MRKLLLPFSLLYQGIIFLRNWAYDRAWFAVYQPPIPVISVGNISLGGTGKTPMAEYILDFYTHHKIQAAYLSRGYGRNTRGFRWVNAQTSNAQEIGDEALQVALKFPQIPVAVCEDRAQGIQMIQKERPVEVLILDDAFQHRKVARSLDIVMLDANRMPHQDFLLPAGNLREGQRSLHRADVLIVNKLTHPQHIPTLTQQLQRWHSEGPLFCVPQLGTPQPFASSSSLSVPESPRVLVFCGIGNNAFFLQQVQEKGFTVVHHRFFRDHYDYKPGDWEQIGEAARTHQAHLILTTEKDYCRIKSVSDLSLFSDIPVAYLPITLYWYEGESRLQSILINRLKTDSNR